MKTHRRRVNAAVLVALFAFLLIGSGLVAAQESPAPVPFKVMPHSAQPSASPKVG